MRCSYAMTTSRVTPPSDEEGADVEEAEEAGGVVVFVCGLFGRSWVSLRLTVVAFMAHIKEVCRLEIGEKKNDEEAS